VSIEAALKLAKIATGRKGIFCFSGGYHGMTQGALSLMGNLGPKQLVEVVQGEGGVIPAPARGLQGLRKLTQQHGVALIVDEVQTGLGRTGRMFAFEHAGIEPDILVLSKAIGGGLPLSVMVYREALDLWKPGAHAGTFRGNQMAMAAGTATLRYIQEQGLASHAEAMGERLMTQLRQIQRDYPCIGQVRGRGLMVGVEIVSTPTEGARVAPADGVMAKSIQQQCLREGVIIELGGRHGAVVRFLPPLTIQAAEIDLLAEKFQVAPIEFEGQDAAAP
jgi:diaminobutyrate-2-oxoglutarate transaminase